MNMRANPQPDVWSDLIGRLRRYGADTPPTEYRCIRCFDTALLVVPHPKSVKFSVDSQTGEVIGGWRAPCLELSVTCSCPLGSEKYAKVNDWLREHKKNHARIWSLRDYYAWLCNEFHEVFGTSEQMAAEWVAMCTPRAKVAILSEARR